MTKKVLQTTNINKKEYKYKRRHIVLTHNPLDFSEKETCHQQPRLFIYTLSSSRIDMDFFNYYKQGYKSNKKYW